MYKYAQPTMLKPDDKLERAVQVLEQEEIKIVLVVDESGKLLGTITDGDIRRSLLRHLTMGALLSQVMCKTPLVAHEGDDQSTLLAMMKSKGILQIPILNDDDVVIGLETRNHLQGEGRYDNPVFLMAGGFGKRLQPLTNDVPKPLLKVGNKPILETILLQLVESGFHNFYISTHYKAEMLQQHFGDGSRWGVNIHYVNEVTPLGTAGALGLLPENLPALPLLMMNGDLLTKVNFNKLLSFHTEQKSIATMCVREYDYQVPYGVIEMEQHQVTSITEKPIYNFFVNAGIYVLEPGLIQKVKGTEYLDMPQLITGEIEKGEKISSYPIYEYWLDIGRIEEYERANREASF
jgi:dTDP-glucose pyrophosphorylase